MTLVRRVIVRDRAREHACPGAKGSEHDRNLGALGISAVTPSLDIPTVCSPREGGWTRVDGEGVVSASRVLPRKPHGVPRIDDYDARRPSHILTPGALCICRRG